MALAGVYAMTAMAVSERRHEMGVRAALGAARLDVFWLVLRESAGTVTLGALIGVGVMASVPPARQAAAADPLESIRTD